jgi:hypothetical protein
MPALEDDDEEWEIEEVVGQTRIDKAQHYLVKWTGWPSEYNQWVHKDSMENAKDAITKFERARKRRRGSDD